MAAINPITVPLPADLPENWTEGQTVAPDGTDAGLTEQHGYNYLMAQVNAAQEALQQVADYFPNLATTEDGGGFVQYTGAFPAQPKPNTLYAEVIADYNNYDELGGAT